VLVVEDDDDARDLLTELIDAMGHRTFQAATAEQALEQVERGGLDMALIDLGLPGLDGCEVARRIRATVAGAGMTLVALTGYSDDATRNNAAEAGFDDFVVKPADPATIERVVNGQLHGGRSPRPD
jgi:DNA-binding response OmpR family regulator